jgi:hypothetical protein
MMLRNEAHRRGLPKAPVVLSAHSDLVVALLPPPPTRYAQRPRWPEWLLPTGSAWPSLRAAFAPARPRRSHSV